MATLNEVYPVPYNILSSEAFQQLDTQSFKDKYDEMIKQFKDKWAKGEKGKDILNVAWTYITTGEIDPLDAIKGVLSVLTLIPEVGPLASAASTIVSFIWPKIFGNKENAKNIFEDLKPQIEALIQQDITNYQNAFNEKAFEGLTDAIKLYTIAIDNDDFVTAKTELDVLNNTIAANIPIFIPEGYETGGLPYYAMVANAHILLLRDAIVNANKLGYSSKEVETHKQYLKEATQTHTKRVMDAFLNGLDKFKVSDVNSYNKRENYIKGMTEMVLDIAALWPTFDPEYYEKEVEIEFTRTILSEVKQPTDKPSSSLDIAPAKNLFYGGELTALQFSTWGTDYSNVFSGIRNTLAKGSRDSNNIQNLDFSYNTQSGMNISRGDTNPIEIESFNPIVSTSFTNTFYNRVMASSFTATFADKTTKNISVQGPLGGAWSNGYTQSDNAPENHKLNYIYKDPNDSLTLRSFVNVYIPMNTPLINELSATKIKGFPAEKGYIANNYTGEVTYYGKSEIINGAQPVDLKHNQLLALPFQSSITGTYTIRIRYASTQGTQGYFGLNNTYSMTPINIPSSHTNGYVMGNIGEYYDFYTIGAYTIKEGNHTLYLQHDDENGMVLDRIEFIPIASAATTINGLIYPVPPGQEQTVWNGIGAEGNYIIIFGTNAADMISIIHAYAENNIEVGTATLVDGGTIYIRDGFSRISIQTIRPAQYPVQFSLQLQNQSPPNFTEEKDLSNITNQVNNLFASSAQDALATDISDYWIEQVVMKVDALSDEVFGKEKKALRKLVNQAKRLSKARNLLVGGNFDNVDFWYMGKNVTKESDHELFKSDHILLPPPTFSPSYIFQKIEESKLKPNTRYTVSGFIAHGEDVELIISRYGQEIQKIMQVPYGEVLPLTSESSSSCCIPRPIVNGHSADPHFFSYNIDVGSLEMEINPGIEFGLRIVKPTGMARVGNLEIREDRPLTAKEIRQVQRAEKDWKQNYKQERTEVIAAIQPILNQINALYENENWNGPIRLDTSYHDLENIVLPTLPKMRHWFMTDRMGEHGNILSRFQEALTRAYTQLESHNLLHNGHFTTDLTNWTSEGDAHHTTLEDDSRHVLRLPDWSSSASQTIKIDNFDPDREYQLIVHAQGEGTVTLQHGGEKETVKVHPHDANTFTTSRSIPVTFETNTVTVEIISEDGEFLVDHIALLEVPEQDTTGNPTIVSNNATIDIPDRL
ncbi:insecticidal delta-endotoxin Cry8Ea1 family protein [Bacillus cereus]|uniref:insecticidal delta-endotoxin Cry8Ea1 family protein n=1 Tax=Bacillus cereus TaxID=1396 RepID=UPI0030ED0E6C